MGEERSYAEAITLIEPEKLPANRVSQYSVITRAMEYQSLLKRFNQIKSSLDGVGLQFGSRILLAGSPGTDFDAFTYYLSREVPLKLVQFKLENMLRDVKRGTEILRAGFEFAKRNSPAILYIENLETICPLMSDRSAVFHDEMKRTSWDNEEVILVATTGKPQDIDIGVLASFDRVYVFEKTTLDDRVRVFEQTMKGRDDIDPTVIAEITDGWGFASLKRLAVSLLMAEKLEGGQIPKDKMEEMIEDSGVIPLGGHHHLNSLTRRISGTSFPDVKAVQTEYPDDFLDQLYLMAVGEDYSATQRVVEVLNDGLPLSREDHEILGKYPFLLNGTPEDRLTRLLRAKKSSDRLRRIMGR